MKRFYLILAFCLASVTAWGEEAGLGPFVMHHVTNGHEWKMTPLGPVIHLPEGWKVFGIDLSISQHILMLLIGTVILLLVLIPAARRKNSAPTGKLGHVVELGVVFLRDEVLRPSMGEEDARRWLPFFLTMFFFLLTLNFLGLIPGFAAATSNLNFTAVLAVMVFFIYNISGMMRNGPVHYFVNIVPKGLPIFLIPFMALMEFLALFTRAFALAVRLFANMTAGHLMILSMVGLIAVFKTYWLAPPFVALTFFVYLIELLVAFLQAYIFTLLSCFFLGMSLNQEH